MLRPGPDNPKLVDGYSKKRLIEEAVRVADNNHAMECYYMAAVMRRLIGMVE